VLTGAALPPAATKCSGLDGDSMVTCNHVSDDAFAERFVRTIKHECLAKVIFVGESMLRRALREFVAHYHDEPPTKGAATRSSVQGTRCRPPARFHRRERLGGLLTYYHRRSA
jgi:putative transposase